ncbi:hypothetical protein D7316_01738 [Gordonia insulae]|uniref:Uncharacterized protein n=1 Tax=Gordonia insulae TaxID=2420509 RepID=A0A3G8JJD5_9ACTN|nr:hypothetical protein D7316_01738 [Gordonia insulae]
MSSMPTPDVSRTEVSALGSVIAAQRNTRGPCMVTNIRPTGSASGSLCWNSSARSMYSGMSQFCPMASAFSPSLPQTVGEMPFSSLGPTTTAPAPSPKMKAVLRSVGSITTDIVSTPTTSTYSADPARIVSAAMPRP